MTRRLVTVLVLLMSVALCACDMSIDVVIHPDGTASIAAELVELAENTDFIRRMPNMADYLDAWIGSLRQAGVLIDFASRGDNEHIYLQRRVSSLEDVSAPLASPAGVQTWSLAERRQEGETVTYRYQGLVDTTSLYRVAPGANQDVTSELHKELNEVRATFSVTLPGRITYSNADVVQANRAVWSLPMNGVRSIIVESRDHAVPAARAGSAAPLWMWVLVGGLLVGGVAGLVLQAVNPRRART